MAATKVARMPHSQSNHDSISPNNPSAPFGNHNNFSKNSYLNITNTTIIMTSPHNLEGITPLMLACQQGRTTDVKNIIKKKIDAVRDRTRSEKVALHFCAEGGSVDCLEVVLEADPRLINAQDEEGYSPLHLAVINGNKDLVKAFIVAKADLNALDNEKHSLVHWATVCGELEILDILLSRGAPATTADIHLAHPIHYAAQLCGNVNGLHSDARARVQSTLYGVSPKKGLLILRRLIKHGVPIDVRDQDGRQPLLWAASAGSADAILSLVNAGSFVEAEDKDGLTALHCAASRGHTDCIETLIGLCGAEVDVIDKNGCTALFYAITLGHADCTELLFNFGAEPNRQDRKGRTPAHCGASKGQLETIKLFAKHEGNLWMRNVRGDLPLHEAVISRRKDLVTWLLSQRPDTVNAQNNDGRCPIHLAALNNNVEMVKILIDHRADLNPLMRTGKGVSMTPLDAAIHRGNSAVAKFLQLHGGLPANSLMNDGALHRRLNRSLESQARSSSSLRGSQMGGHHEQSPEMESRVNFISPEVLDSSIAHQYGHSVSRTVVAESSRVMTSTPIMHGSSMQTDSRHFLRDMEVQVSEDFAHLDEEAYEIRSHITELTIVADGAKNLSAQSGRKLPEKKLRRKRSSRDKSSGGAIDSTDSDTVKQELSISRRVSRSSRKGSDSSPTSQTATSSSSATKTSRVTQKEIKVEHIVTNGRTSSQASSDNYRNESEKFSELENVAIPSSESEIREEDLHVGQATKTVESSQPAGKNSRPGSKKSGSPAGKSPSPDPKSRKSSGKSILKGESSKRNSPDKSRTPSGSKNRLSKGSKHEEPEVDDLSAGEESREPSPNQKASSELPADSPQKSRHSSAKVTAGEKSRSSSAGISQNASRSVSAKVKSRTPSARASSANSRLPSGKSDKFEPPKSKTPPVKGERLPTPKDKSRSASVTFDTEKTMYEDTRSPSSVSAEAQETEIEASVREIEAVQSTEDPSKTLPSRKSSQVHEANISISAARPGSSEAKTEKSKPSSLTPSGNAQKTVSRPQSSKGITKSRTSSAKKPGPEQNFDDNTLESEATEAIAERLIEEIEYMVVRSENSQIANRQSATVENQENAQTTTESSTEATESSTENTVTKEETEYIDVDVIVEKIRERTSIPSQSFESKDSETTTQSSSRNNSEDKSEGTDDIIYENELNQMSLQEAAARRRSKSKSLSKSPTLSKRSVKRKPPPPTNPNYLRTPKSKDKTKTPSPPKDSIPIESTKRISKMNHSPSPSRTDALAKPKKLAAKKPGSGRKSRASKKASALADEEEEIRLQEELLALRKRGNAELNKYTKSKIPTSTKSTKDKPQNFALEPEIISNHVHLTEHLSEGGSKVLQETTAERKRNPSEGNRSTLSLSDDLGRNRDSGYSDQVLPNTSASEDQSRLKMTSKSTGSMRRKVLSKRPKSNTSVILKKSGALSSANATKVTKTVRDRKRFETTLAHRQGVLSQENGSEETTSHGGSATSEEDSQGQARKGRNGRPRSRLTFSKGEDVSNATPHPLKSVNIATPISVTQAMQASMRKYHLERKIFQELLELKRQQIRAGKANEQILVKRLSDSYKKAGLSINYRDYEGPYTFRNFEKYLYDQLRMLQANRKILPRFAPSDDLEKLSTALKKMNATKLPFLDDPERCEDGGNHSQCSQSTHRCHHAAHAYTGVPCAAYIGLGRRAGFLPRVDPLKAPGPTQNDPITRNHLAMNGQPGMKMIVSPRGDPDSPITLEVQQGTKTQVFALPSQSLDPNKNYYVSLSIRPTPSPPVPHEEENSSASKIVSNNASKMGDTSSGAHDDFGSGQISAPPPPLEADGDIINNDINTNAKLNQSF